MLGFVGLEEYIDRMPSELSGGQRRRVAIARAMAAKPRILLYDEATTGLDPITATTVDEEIVKLRDLEGVTSIVVTHQLRDAFFVATHEAVREGSSIEIAQADARKADEAEFIMLKDGVVAFEGNASRAARLVRSVHQRRFSHRGWIHAAHAIVGLVRAEDWARLDLRLVMATILIFLLSRVERVLLAALFDQDRAARTSRA